MRALAHARSTEDEQIRALRFQLFSGVAGAIAAAIEQDASQAVFLIHELITTSADEQQRISNAEDLRAFGATILGLELPASAAEPWCVGPLSFVGSSHLDPSVKLYLAKATTDLRQGVA